MRIVRTLSRAAVRGRGRDVGQSKANNQKHVRTFVWCARLATTFCVTAQALESS